MNLLADWAPVAPVCSGKEPEAVGSTGALDSELSLGMSLLSSPRLRTTQVARYYCLSSGKEMCLRGISSFVPGSRGWT